MLGQVGSTRQPPQKADAVFVQGELRTSEYVKDGVTIPAVSIVAGHLRKIDFSIFAKADEPVPAASGSDAPEQQADEEPVPY